MEETTESAESIIIHYLPGDVLCQIFSNLDVIDLKSTSLVCKLFCSFSSPLVSKLTLKSRSSHFQRLFKRFSGTKQICIETLSCLKLNSVISAICNSDLNLEKLHLSLRFHYFDRNALYYPTHQTIEKMSTSTVIKSIKSLELNLLGLPNQKTFIEFLNQLPSLTELDFSSCFYQWDDEGIHEVTSKLPNLRKIVLFCNSLLTDKTLAILSSNCPKLESVNFKKCNEFTPEALYTFFCNNPQLSSLSMSDFDWPSKYKLVQCMQVLKNLNHLSLYSNYLEDAVLKGLAESRPPLKSLIIQNVFKSIYTMIGLSQLLYACPGLESLDIDLLHCKNCNTYDAEVSIVVKRLPNLKHITVWSRFLCQATLFSLVQNCPLLETISLHTFNDHSGVEQVYYDQSMKVPTKKNHNIKSIKIDPESDVWLLSTIESYCPNLKK